MSNRNSTGRQFSKTLLISFAAMAINYAISLLLTPYITEVLGADAYGFVSLAKTVSGYGVIITTCLNSYASRHIAIAYHEKDFDKANRYYSSVVLANVGLMILVMLGAGVLIWKLEYVFVIPEKLLWDVRILFALDIFNFVFLATVNQFSVYASTKDKLHVFYWTRLASYVIEAGVLFGLYLLFVPRIYYVGVALVISTAVLGTIHYCVVKRELPELKVRIRDFSRTAVKRLVGSGIWNSINSVGNLLNSGLDLWVSNLMLSATSLGHISVVKTLSTIFSTLYQMVAAPLHPKLLRQYAQNGPRGTVSTFNLSMKINGFFATLMLAGFIAYGRMYYRLWVPSMDTALLYWLTVITFIGALVEGIIYPLFYTYTLTVKNKVPCFVTILSGLLNVAGMYAMIRFFSMGAYAVVLTTTVLGWGVYLVFTPLYVAKCLGCSPKSFYYTIGRIMAAGVVMTAVVYLLAQLNTNVSWLSLIGGAIVSCALCAPIYFYSAFSATERAGVLSSFSLRRKMR